MIKSKRFWSTDWASLRLVFRSIIIAAGLASAGCRRIDNVFSSNNSFMPHGYCLQWDPALLSTMILANLGIAIAYFAIPLALWYFVRHRKDLPYPWMFRLFGIFIVACGLTHIMSVWTLYQPFYWLEAAVDTFTAIISLLAAAALWPLIPNLLTLKSPKELEIAYQQLSERDEQFRLLISGVKDYAIYMLDPQGRIITWNEGAERIKGYRADEIIGKNFSCFFSSEDREKGKPRQELELAIKNGRYEEEGLRIRKDGSQFWADIIIAPIYDQSGQLTGFAKITRDITERKQALTILEEQVELLELSNDAIIMREWNGIIRYWNRGAQKIYGYTDKQAIGQNSHELFKTEFPKPLAEVEQDIFTKGRWDGELIHYGQDNRRIIVESRQSLKADPHGNPLGILEINTDITARKEAEQKRLALAEMERVNTELEQFASVASHDLQEPLRAVSGCLQILEKTYKGRLDDNADELIHYAVDGAQRMRTLINDLLALSRVDHEEMTFSATDLSKVLDQVKTNLAPAINESNATISYNHLPTLDANNTLLIQLFQNLISNAIKFRSDTPPQIIIEASLKNGQWLFSVSDNGIGFEQTHADRIFQPFKRLHSKDKYPGTGIGLPICKRIVERHGGRMWVESQPGKGTTFYFTITERGGNNHDKQTA